MYEWIGKTIAFYDTLSGGPFKAKVVRWHCRHEGQDFYYVEVEGYEKKGLFSRSEGSLCLWEDRHQRLAEDNEIS